MVREYFSGLQRLVRRLDDAQDEKEIKQDVALCIMLSVTVVEAFLNIYFRVVVSKQEFIQYEKMILKDITNRKTIEYKLKNWPKKIFGTEIDFTSPIPKAFQELKDRRNDLMHFSSTHQTLKFPGIEFQGLTDTSAYNTLTKTDAIAALDTTEKFICELISLKGLTEEQVKATLQMWTGKITI